jgi:hypothetical protein
MKLSLGMHECKSTDYVVHDTPEIKAAKLVSNISIIKVFCVGHSRSDVTNEIS